MGWSRERSGRCLESTRRSRSCSCSGHCASDPRPPSWKPYHLATESRWQDRASKVSTVAEIRSSHHVLGSNICWVNSGNGDGTERVSATAGERSEANHEEMETRERNHVDSQLSEIGVELTWESKASGDTGHDGRDQVVKIAI